MIHIFEQGRLPTTFVLLHGTGGDEYDLIPLAKAILPGASILSLRGNINEQGMYRFFKRHSPGILDEDSVVEETHNVMTFLTEASSTYSFSLGQAIALGYSNGANLLASLLFHYGDVFQGVLLHHPMMPLTNPNVVSQTSNVWIGAGSNDPIVPQAQTTELSHVLQAAGAKVTLTWYTSGHQLTTPELNAATLQVKQWLTN
jgi:phospholipase/carboxylesterase